MSWLESTWTRPRVMISGSRELPVGIRRDDDDPKPSSARCCRSRDHLRHFLGLGVDEDLPVRYAVFQHLDAVAVDHRDLPVRDHDAVQHPDVLREPRVMR
jgi:hypothetical protein